MEKRVRKGIIVVLIAIMLIANMFTLSACINPEYDNEGHMTVVVGKDESQSVYTVDLSKVDKAQGFIGVLEYLRDNKGLSFTLEESQYGAFLTAVNHLQQSSNKYIYIYTSVIKDQDVSDFKTTTEWESTTLVNAGVGATYLSLEKDSVILIDLIKF